MPYQFDTPVTEDFTLTADWEPIGYSIHFDANGGTGEMEDEEFVYAKSMALTKNGFKREGYAFVGWNTSPDGTGVSYENRQKVKSLTTTDGDVIVLYAMWQANSYVVRYNGNGAESGSMADSVHAYGTASPLRANAFAKRGYTFAGWNTRADGKGVTYRDKAPVTDLTPKDGGVVTLYAKWAVVQYTIKYNPGKGKMPASARTTYNVATKTFTLPRPTRGGYDFDGWYKKSNHTGRIGDVAQGSIGNLTLYAKWVKCTRAAKADSAKITTCKATGVGKVSVKAKISKRVASDDDYYYLMYINPMSQKIYKMAEKAYKKTSISFALKTEGNQGAVVSKYGIAIRKSGKYKLISGVSFVQYPGKAASNKKKYNPGRTKKGMQFYNTMAEIDDCGAKQTFLNVTASQVCDGGTVAYGYNGKTYYFSDLGPLKEIVSECSRKNITVTMQVLLDWTANTDLIHPLARSKGAAPYYTWNVFSNPAREKMEAMFCYLGAVFGRKDCLVSNWVLGNEVNNPGEWNFAGTMSKTNYFKTYAYAYRALYYAMKSQYSNAHVFICTDNCWNIKAGRRFTAKDTVDTFVAQLKKVQTGLQWNLAYHAYSYPLTYTKVWDGYGVTDDVSTPAITMKNLKVLTNYIKKKFGSSHRVILSEQGYTSSKYGQDAQAAAIAYSYYVAACNPMVDAFILRSYMDHPEEARQGMSMGIKGKKALQVYKYMDTAQSSRYTKKCLKTIKAKSWKKIIPGYNASRLRKMYRK